MADGEPSRVCVIVLLYLVGQDEAVGAECEQGCVQVELSPLSSVTWSLLSSVTSWLCSLHPCEPHTEICDHRTQGWPEPCSVPGLWAPGLWSWLGLFMLSSVFISCVLVCMED